MKIRGVLVTLGCCGLLLAACTKAEGGCKPVPDGGDYRDSVVVVSTVDESTHGPAALECSMRKLAACQSTNELVLAPDFKRAVEAFGGNAQTAVLGAGEAPLSEVLIKTLHGPPDDPIRLADGSYLSTACVAHSCTEKGAIVLTPAGSITMAPTLTNHLVNERDFSKDWGPHYSRLDIFLAGQDSAGSTWDRPIRAWAKAAYAGNREHFTRVFEAQSAGLTEYRWLVSPESGSRTKLLRCRIV